MLLYTVYQTLLELRLLFFLRNGRHEAMRKKKAALNNTGYQHHGEGLLLPVLRIPAHHVVRENARFKGINPPNM